MYLKALNDIFYKYEDRLTFKTVPYFIGCKISFHGFYNVEARDNFCKRLIFVYVLVSIHGDLVRTSSQNYVTFFLFLLMVVFRYLLIYMVNHDT